MDRNASSHAALKCEKGTTQSLCSEERRNSANTIDSTRAVHEINTLEVESASNGTKSKTISSQVPVAAAPYRHHSKKPFHPHIV